MKTRILPWLFARIKKHIPLLALLAVINVIQALIGVAVAVESKQMLDLATGAAPAENGSFWVVCQVLSGTLYENLLLTGPNASEDDVKEALYVSDLETFVKEAPDGLQTRIGESNAGISEGQAERIAIARAILRNAPVILLDEATSALDPETERRVLDRIKALPDKTVIAVTHRPYAREIADEVITLGGTEDR